MRTLSISAILLSAVSLGACVSATSEPSYEGKEAEWFKKIAPLLEALSDESSRTSIENLDIGTGVYKGVLHGSSDYDGGVISQICQDQCFWIGNWANYIADARLEVDLGDQVNFVGSLSNFLTKFPGYETLGGEVDFSGQISEVIINGKPAVVFNNMSGSGTLALADVDVLLVDLQSGGAILGSFDGAVATGFMQTDFEWAPGTPFEGSIASWDGALFLTRQ